ncbi:hypothetical protein WJX74_010221 [Apatococcus lobatus]|uniref:Uncharacterized protein n=2 Tax=Apatococcus TaxID=904362 RepID=A0AAW1T0G4_9CHLO
MPISRRGRPIQPSLPHSCKSHDPVIVVDISDQRHAELEHPSLHHFVPSPSQSCSSGWYPKTGFNLWLAIFLKNVLAGAQCSLL